ncbi:GAF domain-containing protein [candidate division KSB1 bacterium]|nr:GAF domain-containing protein [candidate division KSB1 bacterium]
MNILIAHPEISFIDAATQMLSAQNANYEIVGAQTLDAVAEKTAHASFQVCLIDGDFTGNNAAPLKPLEALVDESYIIVLLRENDPLLEQVGGIGAQQTIVKSGDYLLSISEAIRSRFAASAESASRHDVIGFQATLSPEPATQQGQRHPIDQSELIAGFVSLMHRGYSDPVHLFLRRILEVICQLFHFKRATLALLDVRRNVYVKQMMVGYAANGATSPDRRMSEIPRQVIERIFHDRYRMKIIHNDQDQRDASEDDHSAVAERRRPSDKWHKRDLILLSLRDYHDRPYGYISLDEPLDNVIPARSTLQSLDVITRLVSMSIENCHRFNVLANKNRRLRQVLANSNIFKLHLSLTELLDEIAWSAKRGLDFNLVAIVLISKKTQMLETKAVACDDKIKQTQLLALTFAVAEFSALLKDDYLIGQSYLVNREEAVLQQFKQIYYGAETRPHPTGGWPQQALLLVPVRGRDGKTVGFFMADDPQESRIPTPATVQILEILANQIAVAIDNRIMYARVKESSSSRHSGGVRNSISTRDFTAGGFKEMIERFLR